MDTVTALVYGAAFSAVVGALLGSRRAAPLTSAPTPVSVHSRALAVNKDREPRMNANERERRGCGRRDEFVVTNPPRGGGGLKA